MKNTPNTIASLTKVNLLLERDWDKNFMFSSSFLMFKYLSIFNRFTSNSDEAIY